MKYYVGSVKSGKGLLNSMINKLPFEAHIPTYRYCGPGTKLEKRLARGDKGINGLDEACKQHDISYAETEDLKSRHEADKILAQKALARFKAKDASKMEKLAALGVAGVMKTKVKLGMAYVNEKTTTANPNLNNCIKSMEKVKKSTEKSLENIDTCLDTMQRFNEKKTDTKKKWKRNKGEIKGVKTYATHSGQNENFNAHLNPEQQEQQQQPSLLFNKQKSKANNDDGSSSSSIKFPRKRKLDGENDGPFKKTRKINTGNVSGRHRMMRKKKKVNKTTLTKNNSTSMPMMMRRKKRKLETEKGKVDDDVGPKSKLRKLDVRSFRKRKLNIKKDDNDSPIKKSKVLFTRSVKMKKRKLDIDDDEDPLKKIRKLSDKLPINRKRKLTTKVGEKEKEPIERKIRKLHDKKSSSSSSSSGRKRKLHIEENDDMDPLTKIRRQLDILPSNRKRKLNIIQDNLFNSSGPTVAKMPKLKDTKPPVKYDVVPVHRKRKYNDYDDNNNNHQPIIKKPKTS